MSKYWIRPEDGARGTLLLISPEHALRGGPEQTKLVPAVDENADVFLEYTAARMLRRTLMDVGAGRRITAVSGYRPHQEQVKIWEDTMRKEGEKFTRTYVAKPGHSEHESGLAVDLVAASYQILDEAQEDTAEQKWLMENCWKYGFILRYPTEKSEITGIGYEPWHYRYVGQANAAAMHRTGECLEEYLQRMESLRNQFFPEEAVQADTAAQPDTAASATSAAGAAPEEAAIPADQET